MYIYIYIYRYVCMYVCIQKLAVEVATHNDWEMRGELLVVQLEERQNFAKFAQTDNRKVGLMREEEVCVDEHHFSACLSRVSFDFSACLSRVSFGCRRRRMRVGMRVEIAVAALLQLCCRMRVEMRVEIRHSGRLVVPHAARNIDPQKHRDPVAQVPENDVALIAHA